jgi:hypothetical protein
MDKRAHMETHRRERGCKMPRAEMNAPSNKTFKDLADEIFNKETLRRARTLRRRAVLAEVVSWIQVIFGALVTAMAVAVMVEWLS